MGQACEARAVSRHLRLWGSGVLNREVDILDGVKQLVDTRLTSHGMRKRSDEAEAASAA